MDTFVFFGTLEKFVKSNLLTHKGQDKCLSCLPTGYILEFQSGGKEGKELTYVNLENCDKSFLMNLMRSLGYLCTQGLDKIGVNVSYRSLS